MQIIDPMNEGLLSVMKKAGLWTSCLMSSAWEIWRGNSCCSLAKAICFGPACPVEHAQEQQAWAGAADLTTEIGDPSTKLRRISSRQCVMGLEQVPAVNSTAFSPRTGMVHRMINLNQF